VTRIRSLGYEELARNLKVALGAVVIYQSALVRLLSVKAGQSRESKLVDQKGSANSL
jgi:hypothetical protein